MEYKRRILQTFKNELDSELAKYSKEYQRILQDTTLILGDTSINNEVKQSDKSLQNKQCPTSLNNVSYEIADENLLLTPSKNTGYDLDNQNSLILEDLETKQELINGDQVDSSILCDTQTRVSRITVESNNKPETIVKGNPMAIKLSLPIKITNKSEIDTNFLEDNSKTNVKTDKLPTIKCCTIDRTLLEGESRLFDNSISITTSNQTFFNGELRRKARRRIGRAIPKRPFYLMEDYKNNVKRIKFENVVNFYEVYKQMMKQKIEDKVSKDEIEKLRYKMKKLEEELQEKKKIEQNEEIDNFKLQSKAASKKMEEELSKLMLFKQELKEELRNIQNERNNLRKEKEKLYKERALCEKRRIEEELVIENKKLELEKTLFSEEAKKMEIQCKLEEERIRLEKEKLEEIKRIKIDKDNLESRLITETKKLEAERRLIEEEREKINQTFLEITSKVNKENIRHRDDNIIIPAMISATLPTSRNTMKDKYQNNKLFEEFQAAKKAFYDNMNKTKLTSPHINEDKENINSNKMKPINNTNLNILKMSPHNLYKTSIDAQNSPNNPKKYIPKTYIPYYQNEEEFEIATKKFNPAAFTKDPKLNYLVKTQDHNSIRQFFGNKKDIDVEMIFSGIENVTNYSPNKLRKK